MNFDTDRPKLKKRENTCLRALHADATCSYCVEACPSKALRISNAGIDFDADRCIECGICTAACPVEAFTLDGWHESELPTRLRERRDTTSVIFCRRALNGDVARSTGWKVPVCLGSLSPVALFQMALDANVILNCPHGFDCPISQGCEIASKNAEVASTWLDAVGCHNSIAIKMNTDSESKDNADDKITCQHRSRKRCAPKDEQSAIEQSSRREFLTGFVRQGSPLYAVLFDMEYPNGNSNSIAPLVEKHIPDRLVRLKHSWPGNPSGEPSRWPTAIIDADLCRGCGACIQFCPTGALDNMMSESEYEISIIPGICIDCGLCALACPTGALYRTYQTEREPFMRQSKLIDDAQICPHCGGVILNTSSGLCYWCENEVQDQATMDGFRDFLLHREGE